MSPAGPGDGSGSWFEQLEARLDQQLEAFLRANPAQEVLLQEQEQLERTQALQQRRLSLQQQAEGLRAELLELAAEISRWQQRVARARQAGAADLAGQAETHLHGLMEQGRQRWQLLVALGEAFTELENALQQGAAPAAAAAQPRARTATGPELDQAWARFEAEQELEALRRRRQEG
jgi:hercynine metabolism protein